MTFMGMEQKIKIPSSPRDVGSIFINDYEWQILSGLKTKVG